jgi:hypothetical protein
MFADSGQLEMRWKNQRPVLNFRAARHNRSTFSAAFSSWPDKNMKTCCFPVNFFTAREIKHANSENVIKLESTETRV